MSRGKDFWSRRKAGVAAEAEAEKARAETAEQAERDAALADKPDEELLAELGLPDPDTLVSGDDFKAFLAKAVPERLRRRALRRLWASNPVLANLDGLNDYDGDFTDIGSPGGIATAYQVGKGLTAHVEELLRQSGLQEEPQDSQNADPDGQREPAGAFSQEVDSFSESRELHADVHQDTRNANPDQYHQENIEKFSFHRPGRMRYKFDGEQGGQD